MFTQNHITSIIIKNFNKILYKESLAVAADKPVNVQDVFLNHIRKNKTPLTVFLINGVKLQGIVTWFDSGSMLLRRDGHSQLVYKQYIQFYK